MLHNEFACNLFTTFPAKENPLSFPVAKTGNGYLLKFQYCHALLKIHYEVICSKQETVLVVYTATTEMILVFTFFCIS